jgi:hypothetical protein
MQQSKKKKNAKFIVHFFTFDGDVAKRGHTG